MPFSGGGGGQLSNHVHDNTPLQGGPLNFNNTTIGGMNAGDLTYSDGAALQQLAIAAPDDQLRVSAGNIPEWFTPGAAASAWTVLGTTTLGVAATSIDVTWALADVKDFLQIYAWTGDGGGPIRRYLCFYDSAGVVDVGPNYATQFSSSFGGPTLATGATGIAGSDNGSAFETIEVCCADIAQSKLAIRHGTVNTNNSAATAPTNRQMFGKWANTTDEIRGIQLNQGGGAGLYAAGSGMIVLGTDL